MSAVDPRVSFAELCRWPDDGHRYELYDGEVIVVPSPVSRHQRVCSHVEMLLRDYETASGGLALRSPLDIVLSEFDVVQPDIVFFSKSRRHLVNMWETPRVPPDLAVEVLSRSTERRDRGRKMQMFARFGVGEYWIVDPARNTIEIYELHDGRWITSAVCGERDSVDSPTLPGLSFEVRRVFEE